MTTETNEKVKVTAELENEQLAFEVEGYNMENEMVEKEPTMVERKQAILAAIAGALGSGIAGFIGGQALEKRKRTKLLNVVQEGIEMLSTKTVAKEKEIATSLDNGDEFDDAELVSMLKQEIRNVLSNAKVSDKEKAVWSQAMMELMTVTAANAHMEMELKTLKTKKPNE